MSRYDEEVWERLGEEFCVRLNAYASAAGADLRDPQEREEPLPLPAPASVDEQAQALVQAMKAMVEFCLEPLREDAAFLRECAEVSGHPWFGEVAALFENGGCRS